MNAHWDTKLKFQTNWNFNFFWGFMFFERICYVVNTPVKLSPRFDFDFDFDPMLWSSWAMGSLNQYPSSDQRFPCHEDPLDL